MLRIGVLVCFPSKSLRLGRSIQTFFQLVKSFLSFKKTLKDFLLIQQWHPEHNPLKEELSVDLSFVIICITAFRVLQVFVVVFSI